MEVSCRGCGYFEGGERIHSFEQDIHIGRCQLTPLVSAPLKAYGFAKKKEILQDCNNYITRLQKMELEERERMLSKETERILEKVW